MAKGRKADSSKKSKSKKSEDSSKVSVKAPQQDGQGGSDDEGEVWDVVRTITGQESEKHHCSNEDCTNKVVAAWASNGDPMSLWYCCEVCQEKEFGGWPDDRELDNEGNSDQESNTNQSNTPTNVETTNIECPANPSVAMASDDDDPTTTSSLSPPEDSVKVDETSADETSVEEVVAQPIEADTSKGDVDNNSNADNPKASDDKVEAGAMEDDKSDGDEGEVEESDEVEVEEGYDLAAILSEERIMSKDAVLCSVCEKTRACVRYDGTVTKKPWFYCLDCQQKDYEGWPETAPEYPAVPTVEHENNMLKYCCEDASTIERIDRKLVGMGTNDSSLPKLTDSPKMNPVAKGPALTPPPSLQVTNSKKNAPTVTPCEVPCKKATHEKKKAVSATAQKAHAKWLAEAQKIGGPNAKLVLDRPEVKRLVFDVLHDAFGPKNVNDIYEVRPVAPLPWTLSAKIVAAVVLTLCSFATPGFGSHCTSSYPAKLFG
jgi:hypothetical protein